ncbi:MAG: DUF1007 family protein [Hyphomicrobiaceae bacterium]
MALLFPSIRLSLAGRGTLAATGIAGLMLANATPVAAHPHIWVKVETTVLYANGTITGFRHKWTFDEFYTAMAIQGLDTNKDGVYSREELAELAQVNIDGLKEFGFFTQARLGEQTLAIEAPKDFWLEHGRAPKPAGSPKEPPKPDGVAAVVKAEPAPNPGFFARLGEFLFGKAKPKEVEADAPVEMLSLQFTLPLKQPVLAEATDFSFAVFDPMFFIAFDLAEGTPIKLGDGAPQGCRIEMAPTDDAQRLGDAFAQQLGPAPAVGYAATRPVKIVCGSRT